MSGNLQNDPHANLNSTGGDTGPIIRDFFDNIQKENGFSKDEFELDEQADGQQVWNVQTEESASLSPDTEAIDIVQEDGKPHLQCQRKMS